MCVFHNCLCQYLLILMILTCSGANGIAGKSQNNAIDFNRDVRPILSSRCLHCHGPDPATREAELRLDDRKNVTARRSGIQVILPGKPEASELYRRITTTDHSERMPPAETGKQLTPAEIEILRLWIKQGAPYQKHWAFLPPKRSLLPEVKQQDWCQNAIDRFVLARLQQDGLSPATRARKEILLRRVSLDLTGLPPTLREIDQFLADKSGNAYEKVVDRLLNSPAYGEHRARYWLDAARYADTNGYFTDEERQIWQWRDWVIHAFNRNMPFDQFTIEQLAGDLLPKPTQDQLIATGFNRNHMTTIETGVIDEEYRVEYVVNRVETTSTVWLGLTMGCARCHDHKFDPITQKEFYQFFAFFNNVQEKGNSGVRGNAPPVLQVPTVAFNKKLNALKARSAEAQQKFNLLKPELTQAQAAWEKTALNQLPKVGKQPMLARYPFDNNGTDLSNHKHHLVASGSAKYTEGWNGSAVQFDGDTVMEAKQFPDLDREDSFTISCWMKASSGGPVCLLSKNDDTQSLRGFDIMLRKSKLVAHLVHKWNTNAIQVISQDNIKTGRWQHVLVTYDGSSKASGIRVYLDGVLQSVTTKYDSLTRSIRTKAPLRIGRRSTSAPYKGDLDELLIYNREFSSQEVSALYARQMLSGILNRPADKRDKTQLETLRNYYITHHAAPEYREALTHAKKLSNEVTQLARQIPTSMVMQEQTKPRKTFILKRGQYDQPGAEVSPAVPLPLSELSSELPQNRLGLAKWLVSRNHPLTARVTVNRIWQQIFGRGLVKSTEDFGSQGAWPTHPELLDWLSVEFMESGWDLKHLIKLIVMSNTYQQSSRIPVALRERDPENQWLARGPRFRLDAEVIRDASLKISGLLVDKIGGPSVKPYQPKGLWAAVSYDGNITYQQDKGDNLYRRSLYTYWKRQSPPPALMAFDAPTRETCTVNRPRTNTPLQALVLLNDPTYIEAARMLAQNVLRDYSREEDRIRAAFRCATGRQPAADERIILQGILQKQRLKYLAEPKAAARLVEIGESKRDTTIEVSQHAAWTVLCSLILNLNETVTKN